MVLALGDKATFDIYLLNDSHKPIGGKLILTSSDPSGVNLRITEFDAPTLQPDHFSYLLKEGFATEALNKAGTWRFRLQLEDHSRRHSSGNCWL